MGNVEVRKNKEGYELNLNALIYSELLMKIQSLGITKQAIELCCRIVSADGSYLESEKNFIHKLCNSLNMPESQVCSVDEIVELMAKESNLLDNISA